jgi:hypothetical protein
MGTGSGARIPIPVPPMGSIGVGLVVGGQEVLETAELVVSGTAQPFGVCAPAEATDSATTASTVTLIRPATERVCVKRNISL